VWSLAWPWQYQHDRSELRAVRLAAQLRPSAIVARMSFGDRVTNTVYLTNSGRWP